MKCLQRFSLYERVALNRLAKKGPIMFLRVWFFILTGRKIPFAKPVSQ